MLQATYQVVVLRLHFANVGRRLVKTPKEPQFYFWRASAGTEVDFVVDTAEKLIPIEVKLSATLQLRIGLKEQMKVSGRAAPDKGRAAPEGTALPQRRPGSQ